MKIRVVSLLDSIGRRASFREAHRSLPFEFFDAVDGRVQRDPDLLDAGLIAPGLGFSRGAIGCALSHRALWRRVVAEGEPLTIVEDDALLRSDFAQTAEATLASLPTEWELVLWGFNFDALLACDALPGLSPCIMTFDQEELRENLAAFQANVVETRTYRLHHAFGLLCYSISPRGAEKLIASCFPLAPIEVAYPGDRKIRTIGLDATMNAFYREMLAYVCFPPLAVSPNDHATSSTVEERADSARPTAFDLTPSSRLRLSTEARYAIAGDDRGVLLLKRDALVGELPNVALPLIAGIFERGSFAAEEATALSGEAWEDVRELLLGLLELDVVCLDEEEAVGSAQSSRPPAP